MPADWTAPDYATNAAQSLALRARLDLLVGADHMRGAEQGLVLVNMASQLTAVLEGGTPSLSSAVSPSYRPVLDDIFAEFVELAAAGPVDLVNDQGAFTPGAQGGIGGTSSRGINEGGLEVRQLVDKALFSGAALYNHAATLTAGTITPATVEAIAAAWGANAALDGAGMLTDAASYSQQMGYHARLKASLVAAHTYAGNSACSAQRDDALRTFFADWEESMQVRLVYYISRTITQLGMAENDKVEGLHGLTEGIGLTFGFHGLQNPASGPLSAGVRIITDAQVEAILTALRVNRTDLGASTTGNFVATPADLEAARTTVEGIVGTVYGLTAAELVALRAPTAG